MKPVPPQAVGIDFGIKHQLTLSNPIQLTYEIPIPKRIRRLYQRLAKKQPGSQNYWKVLQALHKAFATWTNRKRDVTNQLTSLLTSQYQYICFQDDPIAHWQRLWGRHILNTNLSALITNLKTRSVTPCLVDQWTATTKRCSQCGFVLQDSVALFQQVFTCPACEYTAGRDVNAARCIEQLGLASLSQFAELPTGRRNVKPRETSTAPQTLVDLFNRISFVRACLVNE
ncbi:MAG: zinc ribbon domain-containing protein [Candidatus Hermodarchaeota archaeon]